MPILAPLAPSCNSNLAFSVYPPGSRANAHATHRTCPWDAFAAWLAAPLETANKHAQGFSPLVVTPGKGGRSQGDASILLGEVDADATPAIFARARALLAGFDAVLYTTASAEPDRPRFRYAIRPSRPLDAAGQVACARQIAALLGVDALRESRERTRLWYRPITGGKMPPVVVVSHGAAWDVDAALAEYPPPPKRERGRPRTAAELPAVEVRTKRLRGKLPALKGRSCSSLDKVTSATPFANVVAIMAACREHAVDHVVELERLNARLPEGEQWTGDELAEVIANATPSVERMVEPGAALDPPLVPRAPEDAGALRERLAMELTIAPTVGIVAVIGPMGIGKSYQAARLFGEAGRALAVAPTRALAEHLAAVLQPHGALLYTSKQWGAPRAVSSFHSAYRYALGDLDLAFVDEVVEVERQLHSSIVEHRRIAAGRFVDLLTAPRRVLIMGADLTRGDVERYERMTGRPIHVIDLSAHTVLARTVVETSIARAKVEADAALRRPGRVYLHVDSPRDVEIWAALARNVRGFNARVVTVHGKTDRAAIATLNAGAWDVLIVNSAAASGVSIDVPVAAAIVIRNDRQIVSDVHMQSIGRPRVFEGAVVYVGAPDWSHGTEDANPITVRADLERTAAERRAFVGLGAAAADVIDEPLMASWVACEIKARERRNDPGLRARCERAGWGWIRLHDEGRSPELPRALRDELKTFGGIVDDSYARAVLGAAPLEDHEAEELRRQYAPTPEDHARLARHAVESFVSRETWARLSDDARREIVLANRSGRWVHAMVACVHMLDAAGAAEIDRERQLDGGGGEHVTEVRGRALVGAFRRQLWAALFGREAPKGAGDGASASKAQISARVRAWVAQAPAYVRRQLGGVPRDGAEVEWCRGQLRAFGVRVTVEGEHVRASLPPLEHLARHAVEVGIRVEVRSRRGPAPTLPPAVARAALGEHGSQRRAAAALGVSLSMLQRAIA